MPSPRPEQTPISVEQGVSYKFHSPSGSEATSKHHGRFTKQKGDQQPPDLCESADACKRQQLQSCNVLQWTPPWQQPEAWAAYRQYTPKLHFCLSSVSETCLNQVVYTTVLKVVQKPMVPIVNGRPVNFHWATIYQISRAISQSATNDKGCKAVIIVATADARWKQDKYLAAPLTIRGRNTVIRRRLARLHGGFAPAPL